MLVAHPPSTLLHDARVMTRLHHLLAAALATAGPAAAQTVNHQEVARRVLATTPLIDGHNDLPYAMYETAAAPGDVAAPEHDLRARTPFHTDIERLRAGMVGAQFWSVYIPYAAVEEGAAKRQLEQIDIALQIIELYPDVFGLALDASDHTSPETMNDALDVSEAPVIWSHAGARAVTEHTRNVPDQVLRRLPDNGGVVMIVFNPPFVSSREEATLSDVADHVDHVAALAGVDHVGIGSDYDGIDQVPRGLEDVSTFPALLAELSRREWSEADLRKLAGENVLRVMREAEAVARRLQRERPPSTKTIAELDVAAGSGR